MKSKKTVIYGAGKAGQKAAGFYSENSIVAFIDDDPQKCNTTLLDRPVLNSQSLHEVDYDQIAIANLLHSTKIKAKLIDIHEIPEEKIEILPQHKIVVSYDEEKNFTAITQSRRQYLQSHQELTLDFQSKTKEETRELFNKYYWYHTIDLGNGLITPDSYDYREILHNFNFPQDMSGMKVLDVGSATGYFAFEFEKRGADVTSIELPSTADWDMVPEEKDQNLDKIFAIEGLNSLEELDLTQLRGPFDYCHEKLNSKVKRVYANAISLKKEDLPHSSYDLIFLGDLLIHTFSPFAVLANLSQFCHGEITITQSFANDDYPRPIMDFSGNAARTGNCRTWWFTNKECLVTMLKRLGFKTVTELGEYATITRPMGRHVTRTVIKGQKC